MKALCCLVAIFALFSQQSSGFQECGGNTNLTSQLNSSASKAAKWLTTRLAQEQSKKNLYIDATAFYSLRLAGEFSTRLNISLKEISRMNGGKLGLYLNGISASCGNHDERELKRLVKWLKHCTDTTIVKCGMTHPFQYLTAALALCNSGRQFPNLTRHHILTSESTVLQRTDAILNSPKYSIDTCAMGLLTRMCITAQICERGGQELGCERVKKRNGRIVERLIKKQNKSDGSFGGNGISTALAVQALLAYHAPSTRWQCSKTMEYILRQQKQDGSFSGLMPTIQILPVLKGATLLDHHRFEEGCSVMDGTQQNKVVNQMISTVDADATSADNAEKNITVALHIEVTNKFDCQYNISVKQGSSAHDVLKTAADQYTNVGSDRCESFSFKASSTRYGAYVTSMLQYNEDIKRKRHWMMYEHDGRLATVGIDDCRPQNGTKIIFKFGEV